MQGLLAEEEQAVAAAEAAHPGQKGVGGEAVPSGGEEDELDAFMGQVAVQLEHDKASTFIIITMIVPL